MRPSAIPSPKPCEPLENLLADLEAASPDAGADGGGGGAERLGAAGDDPGSETAPAAVEHPDSALATNRDRKAVGDLHERRQLGVAGELPVGLGEPLAVGPRVRSRGRVAARQLGAVNLMPDEKSLGVATGERRHPAPVLEHGRGRVRRQQPDVELSEVALADAPEPRRERRPGAGEPSLEPARTVVSPLAIPCSG